MQNLKNNLLIPVAIVIAGGMIAGSMYLTKKPAPASQAANTAGAVENPEKNMPPISAEDHILGNPNAPVVLVEYSDTDCPYCQAFHPTLNRIVSEYGKNGQVAWVYRHFAFHAKAPKEAEATECAADVGGNEKFSEYLDLLFKKKDFKQNPYKGLDESQLPVLAASIGIDKAKFSACLDSGKYADKVAAQYQDAVKSGASGTPYLVIVTKNGNIPVSGAVPYETLKGAIQSLLNEVPQQ